MHEFVKSFLKICFFGRASLIFLLVFGNVDSPKVLIGDTSLCFFKIRNIIAKHKCKLTRRGSALGFGNIKKLAQKVLGELYINVIAILHRFTLFLLSVLCLVLIFLLIFLSLVRTHEEVCANSDTAKN